MIQLYAKVGEEINVDNKSYICKIFTSCMNCDMDVKNCNKIACHFKERRQGENNV